MIKTGGIEVEIEVAEENKTWPKEKEHGDNVESLATIFPLLLLRLLPFVFCFVSGDLEAMFILQSDGNRNTLST